MGAPSTRGEIQRRRRRREKIDILRRRYAKAGSDTEREAIWGKARQLSPQMSYEEFRGPIAKPQSA
jgi:hypothetical protein